MLQKSPTKKTIFLWLIVLLLFSFVSTAFAPDYVLAAGGGGGGGGGKTTGTIEVNAFLQTRNCSPGSTHFT